jgi:ornithine carbamoyltransferase
MAVAVHAPCALAGRDLLAIDQLQPTELVELLDLAEHLKRLQLERVAHRLLPGRTLAMIFQKPSTRTRVSFEVGITQLGGTAVAHVLTLRERLGPLEGRRLAWVGDGCNNVCHSLISAAGMLGMRVTVATPLGFEPDPVVVAAAGHVTVVEDPAEAVAGADAVATDVWTSMGQEAEREQRIANLAPYQVNRELLRSAGSEPVVLHCLPAHYDEEITRDVLHGPSSAAWDEAENRLHAQKALMAMVMA